MKKVVLILSMMVLLLFNVKILFAEGLVPDKEISVSNDTAANTTLASTIVSDARSYVGKLNYVYGGNSLVSGADCSGFICAIYEQYGYNLWSWRTSMRKMPSSVATNVGTSISNALPGDIICYSGHVGIYSGNNMLINAANSKQGVVEKNYSYYGSVVAIMRINGVVQSVPADLGDNRSPFMYAVKISDVNNTGFTVTISARDPDGVANVGVAVWGPTRLTENNKDDFKIYKTNTAGTDVTGTIRVTLSDLRNLPGNYHILIMATDGKGYSGGSYNASEEVVDHYYDIPIEFDAPTISDVRISDVTIDGYKVTCTVTDASGIDRVQFPTWTTENGQDDLKSEWWVNSDVSGSIEGNTVSFYVNRAEHNGEVKDYITDIYAYDKFGNCSSPGRATVSSLIGEPQDLGNDFTAVITNVYSKTAVTKDADDNVTGRKFVGGKNQYWRFVRKSNGSYQIFNLEDANKCLDAYGMQDTNETNVQAYEKNDSGAQEWFLYKNVKGYFLMPSYSKSRGLDLRGSSKEEGTNIKLFNNIGGSPGVAEGAQVGDNAIFLIEKRTPVSDNPQPADPQPTDPKPAEKETIRLNPSSVSLKVGETKLIDVIGAGRWIMTTSNPSVVKFQKRDASIPDSSVKIVAISAGTSVITATLESDSSVTATCVVTVTGSDTINAGTGTRNNNTFSVRTPHKQTLKWARNRKGRKLEIEWKYAEMDDGYQVEIATNRSFTKGRKVKTYDYLDSNIGIFSGNAKFKKLRKKTYYVHVRAYRNTSAGRVYGAWSNVKKVKIKK